MDTTTGHEQRAAVRFDRAMPVQIGGAAGETHNISAQGVYLETDVVQSVGELVNFTVEFQLGGRTHRLLCEGKVVRVDRENGRIGVAARLVAPFFDGVEEIEL